jgi:O-antigen/teichoic acid export membrane protein
MLYPFIILLCVKYKYGELEFGYFAYASSILLALCTFYDFGFDVSMPSLFNKDGKFKCTISESFGLKLQIIVLVYLIFLGAVFFQNQVNKITLIFSGLILGIGYLYPSWIFIYKSEYKELFYYGIVGRLISLLLVFSSLTLSDEINLVVFMSSTWPIVTLMISNKRLNIKINFLFKIKRWKILTKEVVKYFIPIAVSTSYVNFSTIFVSNHFGLTTAGYYFLADKFRNSIQSIYIALIKPIYPLMLSNEKNLRNTRKYYFIVLIGSIIFTIFIHIFSGIILNYLNNLFLSDVENIFNILLIAIPFVAIGYFNSYIALASVGRPFAIMSIYIFASVYFIACIFLTKIDTIIYFSYIVLSTEVLIAIYSSILTYRILKKFKNNV